MDYLVIRLCFYSNWSSNQTSLETLTLKPWPAFPAFSYHLTSPSKLPNTHQLPSSTHTHTHHPLILTHPQAHIHTDTQSLLPGKVSLPELPNKHQDPSTLYNLVWAVFLLSLALPSTQENVYLRLTSNVIPFMTSSLTTMHKYILSSEGAWQWKQAFLHFPHKTVINFFWVLLHSTMNFPRARIMIYSSLFT